jgi:hypothetical protein
MTYLGTCSVPEEKVVKAEAEAEADSLNVLTLTVLAATTAVAAAEGITEIQMERFLLVEKGGGIGATMMLRIVVDLSGEVLVYHQSREPAGINRNSANRPLSFF